MPPTLALTVWFVLLMGLLRYDPARDVKTSGALWLPLTWLIIAGSKLPSQWLGQEAVSASAAYHDGNILDAATRLILMLIALCLLAGRSVQWRELVARNQTLALFLCFTLVSVAWSDFPFVAAKRWFRDLGIYLMVIVVLSDPRPDVAVKTVLRRFCYVLIPLSVVLIKYYPHLGRGYEKWTGAAIYLGATTSKNMLGIVCLVSGLFFFWDTVRRWADRRERQTKRVLLVNIAFIGMTLWLLGLADSATSRLCLVVGCAIIAAAHTESIRRSPIWLKTMIPTMLCAYLVLEYGFGITDSVIKALGRESTLTGRTLLWPDLLDLAGNPLLGAGYESFWLGHRLDIIWGLHPFGPNQAHNGYLEIYLNLGLLGLGIVLGFMISRYRRLCRDLTSAPGPASFALAMWTVLLLASVTEASFKFQVLWFALLLVTVSAPQRFGAQRHERIARTRSKFRPASAR